MKILKVIICTLFTAAFLYSSCLADIGIFEEKYPNKIGIKEDVLLAILKNPEAINEKTIYDYIQPNILNHEEVKTVVTRNSTESIDMSLTAEKILFGNANLGTLNFNYEAPSEIMKGMNEITFYYTGKFGDRTMMEDPCVKDTIDFYCLLYGKPDVEYEKKSENPSKFTWETDNRIITLSLNGFFVELGNLPLAFVHHRKIFE